MKTHITTLATALKRGLRSSVAAALILHFTAPAAEPLCWERAPNRPAPAQFDTFHGQSLDFRCTFTGFGSPPFAAGEDVRLWYQTNGMGAAWWSVPATVSSNMISAVWGPSADPGAERLTVFFGAPSNAYAAAQVRFRNSPGAAPNHLDPPSVLDWQAELAAVSNALAAAIETVATNLPPGMTTNDVSGIVTNEVVVGYGPWTCDPAEMEGVPILLYEDGGGDGRYWMIVWFGSQYGIGDKDSTYLTFELLSSMGTNFTVRATRQRYTRNALGLARISDISNIAESVVNATVTGVVRSVSFKVKDYIFDPVTEVCWRRQMVDGFLDYIAVTNIDVTLPENYEALEALERRDNQ